MKLYLLSCWYVYTLQSIFLTVNWITYLDADIFSNNAGELNSVYTDVVGEHDLMIVGPGVLGRIVAEKWQQVLFKFI